MIDELLAFHLSVHVIASTSPHLSHFTGKRYILPKSTHKVYIWKLHAIFNDNYNFQQHVLNLSSFYQHSIFSCSFSIVTRQILKKIIPSILFSPNLSFILFKKASSNVRTATSHDPTLQKKDDTSEINNGSPFSC